MTKKNKEKKEKLNDLENLGLQAIKNFFGVENGLVESLNNKQLNFIIQKARIGMQLYKENNVMRRAEENNTFRFCTLIADNKDELNMMLKYSLPNYDTEKR